jgi:hypothetical protein
VKNLKWRSGALIVAGTLTAFLLQRQMQQSLHAENESLAAELAQLKTDKANLPNQISAANNSLSDKRRSELLRLRAEVTQLRAASNLLATAPLPITNDPPEAEYTEIKITMRIAAAHARQMPVLNFGGTTGGDGTSLLSKEQLDRILKLMDDGDLDKLEEAEVTTLNGRQANYHITQPTSVADFEAGIGQTVDVVPYYSIDLSIFKLTVLTQLIKRTDDPSHPVQTLVTSNQLTLFPGQTTALEQDLPPGISLPETPNIPEAPGRLLVFITPTVVEAEEKIQIPQSSPSGEAAIQK